MSESQYMGLLQNYHAQAFEHMEQLSLDVQLWISDKPSPNTPTPILVMGKVNRTRAILETIVRLTTTKPFINMKSKHEFCDFLNEQVTELASFIDDVETVAMLYQAEQQTK